ncbi:MAG: hypothetical protein ACP5I4_04205 [Oceanipulchritudo sp.]
MFGNPVKAGILLHLLLGISFLTAEVTLLDRNPFVWPGFQANNAAGPGESPPSTSGDFEFHAVYELSGTTHFLLRDRKNNAFHWVSLGEEKDGILPKSYDPEKDELLLAYESRETTLSLQGLPEASGQPASMAAAQPSTSVRAATRSPSTSRSIRRTGSSASSRRAITRTRVPSRTSTAPVPPSRLGATRSGTARTAASLGLREPTQLPPPFDMTPPDTPPPESTPPPPAPAPPPSR